MSQKHLGLEMASELVTRLDSTFDCKAIVLCGSPDCWTTIVAQPVNEIDPLMADLLRTFDTKSQVPVIARRDGKIIALVKAGEKQGDTIVVGMVIPDQNELLVCSVISAHLEALQQREQAKVAQIQIESFIAQVTQDFEELTWLRNANEYLDLCDSKNTIGSIATQCLPDLAHVIRAESICFIPSKVDKDSVAVSADLDRVIATGQPISDPIACYRFLNDSTQSLACGLRVANVTPSQSYIPGLPGARNCIAVKVAKGISVYGWLFAINKISSVEQATLDCDEFPEIVPSFGTFEAGLVSAAASIMSSHARNVELFEAQESLTIGVVRAIINAIDAKDTYTCGHSDRVAMYSKKIAARLALDAEECERIYMAGLLHDVGKIGIPDMILSKPGKLTDEEYAIVKKHPEIGYHILEHLTQLRYVLPGVLHHHEAVNGKGYPAGLAGDAIPLHGRILAVADAYDAMTSDRPYRAGMPSEKAESIMRAESGKTWDPDIVLALLECLENGEIRPHCIDSNTLTSDVVGKSDANVSLMNRIGNSINCLTLG
jgi:HD-GYP domain-containing protein (c-di-GMP phosphodiesterase class II)